MEINHSSEHKNYQTDLIAAIRTFMAKIAVLGPGAIGGTIILHLREASVHSVVVCARSRVDKLVLETPGGQLSTRPEFLLAPESRVACDWVFITTKAYDAEATGAWLPYLVGPETRVAVLQNGVEHVERFQCYVTQDQIVPVVVNMPVERIAPGHFRQRRPGQLTAPDTQNGYDFSILFERSGIITSLIDDFKSVLWKKLALNCAGAVLALVLKPAGISRTPRIAEIMRALVRECILVGRAEGATLDDDLIEQVISSYQNGPADAVNSLHADRLANRPIELDARNGAVVRIAWKHGIDVPVNQMIVDLLEASVEDARLSPVDPDQR